MTFGGVVQRTTGDESGTRGCRRRLSYSFDEEHAADAKTGGRSMKFHWAILLVIIGLGLSFCPIRAATLFGLVDTGELFASNDGGVSWSVLSTLPVSDATAIAAAETSSELYMATESGSIYRSPDAGVNWTATGSVSASNVVDMLIHSSGDILLLTKTGDIYLSSDDGVSFSAVATLTASNHVALDGDEGGGDNLYALTRTGEVAKSVDGGSTWNVVGAITTPDAVDIQSLGLDLYVLTGTGIISKSTDQGVTWMTMGTISQVHMTGMTRDGQTWVATTREGLVATSADAVSWSFVGSINQLNVISIGNDVPQATGIGPDRPPAIAGLSMAPPWPNPLGAHGLVNVAFDLPTADVVTIQLFNAAGQLVARRPAQRFPAAGGHTASWAIPTLPSGIYFVRLATAQGLSAQRKIAIVR